jgi:tRNA-modifying protein YgfZ
MAESQGTGALHAAPIFPHAAAVVPVGAWELAHATGNDRIAFLHRLVTGRIEGLAPGDGSRALLLTVKGHIVSDLRVAVDTDRVHLVVPPGQGETTVTALSRYAVMDDFEARLDTGARLLAVHGPACEERLRASGVAVPDGFLARPRLAHAQATSAAGSLWLLREQAAGAAGIWCFGEASAVQALADELRGAGVPDLDPLQAEVLRIRAGEPRFGAEINADYFPMESGLTRAIDYSKGCYLGQEPIVRIRDRGHLNWRLVTLVADAPGPVAVGDRLEADIKPKAGRITSVAALPGQPAVALGMLHMSVPVGTPVRIKPAAQGDAGAEAPGIPASVTSEVDD